MNTSELTIQIGKTNVKIFMQAGFFYYASMLTPLHNHTYAEIHFIERGTCDFYIGDMLLHPQAGDVLAIPAGVFHYYTAVSPDLRHCAFQAVLPLKEFKRFSTHLRLLTEMLDLIDGFRRTGRSTRLSCHLALLCSYFVEDRPEIVPRIEDRELLIYEFFSTQYNKDVTLADLAEQLSLSKKQTERMVKKYTGHSFRAEITRRRINAAIQLMNIQDISLSEVAARVGYKSYSGFWKAYKESQNTQ